MDERLSKAGRERAMAKERYIVEREAYSRLAAMRGAEGAVDEAEAEGLMRKIRDVFRKGERERAKRLADGLEWTKTKMGNRTATLRDPMDGESDTLRITQNLSDKEGKGGTALDNYSISVTGPDGKQKKTHATAANLTRRELEDRLADAFRRYPIMDDLEWKRGRSGDDFATCPIGGDVGSYCEVLRKEKDGDGVRMYDVIVRKNGKTIHTEYDLNGKGVENFISNLKNEAKKQEKKNSKKENAKEETPKEETPKEEEPKEETPKEETPKEETPKEEEPKEETPKEETPKEEEPKEETPKEEEPKEETPKEESPLMKDLNERGRGMYNIRVTPGSRDDRWNVEMTTDYEDMKPLVGTTPYTMAGVIDYSTGRSKGELSTIAVRGMKKKVESWKEGEFPLDPTRQILDPRPTREYLTPDKVSFQRGDYVDYDLGNGYIIRVIDGVKWLTRTLKGAKEFSDDVINAIWSADEERNRRRAERRSGGGKVNDSLVEEGIFLHKDANGDTPSFMVMLYCKGKDGKVYPLKGRSNPIRRNFRFDGNGVAEVTKSELGDILKDVQKWKEGEYPKTGIVGHPVKTVNDKSDIKPSQNAENAVPKTGTDTTTQEQPQNKEDVFQNQKKEEPQAQVQSKEQIKPETKPEPEEKPQVQSQPQPQPQAQVQSKEQIKPETKPEPEEKPQAQPQDQPQSQPQSQPQAQVQSKEQIKPETKPEPEEKPQAQVQSQPQAQPQEQTRPETKTEPQAQPQERKQVDEPTTGENDQPQASENPNPSTQPEEPNMPKRQGAISRMIHGDMKYGTKVPSNTEELVMGYGDAKYDQDKTVQMVKEFNEKFGGIGRSLPNGKSIMSMRIINSRDDDEKAMRISVGMKSNDVSEGKTNRISFTIYPKAKNIDVDMNYWDKDNDGVRHNYTMGPEGIIRYGYDKAVWRAGFHNDPAILKALSKILVQKDVQTQEPFSIAINTTKYTLNRKQMPAGGLLDAFGDNGKYETPEIGDVAMGDHRVDINKDTTFANVLDYYRTSKEVGDFYGEEDNNGLETLVQKFNANNNVNPRENRKPYESFAGWKDLQGSDQGAKYFARVTDDAHYIISVGIPGRKANGKENPYADPMKGGLLIIDVVPGGKPDGMPHPKTMNLIITAMGRNGGYARHKIADGIKNGDKALLDLMGTLPFNQSTISAIKGKLGKNLPDYEEYKINGTDARGRDLFKETINKLKNPNDKRWSEDRAEFMSMKERYGRESALREGLNHPREDTGDPVKGAESSIRTAFTKLFCERYGIDGASMEDDVEVSIGRGNSTDMQLFIEIRGKMADALYQQTSGTEDPFDALGFLSQEDDHKVNSLYAGFYNGFLYDSATNRYTLTFLFPKEKLKEFNR